MAQQSARRGRKNQMYSSCLEHAFMIWFRSANSHTGPQLHRCIRGRTDGSIRLRANLLQKPLASGGASTDEYTALGAFRQPGVERVLGTPARRDPHRHAAAWRAVAERPDAGDGPAGLSSDLRGTTESCRRADEMHRRRKPALDMQP